MFVRSVRHHRSMSRLFVAVAAAAALVLTACAPGQAQPTDYGVEGELFYDNFMIGCTEKEPDENGSFEHVDAEVFSFCECVFRGMKERIPFADAMAFEESMADIEEDDEFEVPQAILTIMNGCNNGSVTADNSADNGPDTDADDADSNADTDDAPADETSTDDASGDES